MSRNPTGASGAEPLDDATRAKLVAFAGAEGCDLQASFPELSEASLARALTGKSVRPSTRALVRLGLERLAAAKLTRDLDVIDRSLAPRGLQVNREAVSSQLVHNHGPVGRRIDVTGPVSINITDGKVEVAQ